MLGKKIKRYLNLKAIAYVLGVLMWVEAGMFLLCSLVSLWFGEASYQAFLYALCVNAVLGLLLMKLGKGASRSVNRRDGYAIVALSWLSFSFLGMLPYIFSGEIPSVTNAFFETMSGFTTTGATILDDIESLSHGMLFWRSFTQWVGGLGMICFTIAMLPIFGQNNQVLFSSEATGVIKDKVLPKIGKMTKWIWLIYITLTATLAILLLFGGMNLFDAVCHAFTTTATGGYSTKQASIAYWNSPFIEYVISIFMLLSCVNFTLYFLCLHYDFKRMFQDQELRWFMGSVTILTLIITGALYFQNDYGLEKAFRCAFFQIASIHTSTGFGTDDYMLWPHFTWMLLLFAMLAGGCTGSTGGGIKNLRILILYKNIHNEFIRMIHPTAVIPIRINRQVLPSAKVTAVFTFTVVYFVCGFVACTFLMVLGLGFTESISTVISSLGNVGPGMGAFGPAFSWNAMPDAAKWIHALLMMVGRLELFSVLVVLTPSFWKD